ncbi:MAG: molybdopterin-dependent oxidoreductase [Desulfobacterales bacterium]|nr:molybdopterin-dependent oxidoreductase [Desulfobacterales bacterium]
MENILFTINSQKISCPSGTTILDAAVKNGIDIPTLCHHPQLKPHGACRICLVEDEKTKRLMASCVTPVMPDMAILTETPRVLNHRRNIVRLMMAEHPESCIVCGKGNRCDLRKIAARLGIGESNLYPMPNFKPYEHLNPFIIRDLSKCILCGKCIRADHELVVAGSIDYNNRGFKSRPATLHEMALEDSNCTFCGTCVSLCPTGALSARNTRYVGTPEKESDSICAFCGVGCTLTLGVSGNQVIEVNPSKYQGTVNGATLCVRGHFAGDFINSPDRLTQPMIRTKKEDGSFAHVPASWDAALDSIVEKLSEIKRQHGPGSLAFIGSSKCSNEENYLFQKIARVIFGTGNLVNGGYALGQQLIYFMEHKAYGTCRQSSLQDLENAQAILVVRADTDHEAPVVGYHIKRAAKKGVPVIVLDSRKTDVVPLSSVWLRPRISSKLGIVKSGVINSILKMILESGAQDSDFINRYTEGIEKLIQSMNTVDPEKIALESGIKPSLIEKAFKILKGKKIAIVIGTDILHYPEGPSMMDAVFNLALLTGSIGAKGSGFFFPLVKNNLMGAMDMGTVPDLLPGRRPLASSFHRETVEKMWQVKLSAEPGLDMVGFIEAAESGKVKAAYIMGENIVRSLPQSKRVESALKKLDLLIVQDIFYDRTAKLADVILPGATVAEKSGSFTNMEGRFQTFFPVVNPPGNAHADWEILSQLSKKMGYPEQYISVEKIRQEIRRVIPMYERIGNHRQDWIKNNDLESPFSDPKKKFVFTPVTFAPEMPADSAHPLMAVIGSSRYHLGSGSRTSRSERIRAFAQNGAIEISPSDCVSLGLGDCGKIRVTSSCGMIERQFKVNPDLPSGQVFIPSAVNGNDAMNLVDLIPPGLSGVYGWTVCKVSIDKI